MTTDSISKTNRRKISAVDYAAAAVFLLLVVFLALCARNGIGVPDESFYLTIPQRVFNGDGLISDDWHVSQFSSFIQYPFYAVFRWITGSTEGIILYFRCLYIFFQCLCAVICWPSFRRYGFIGLAGISYFAFFIPVSVMAINYYTASLWPVMILSSAFLRDRKPGRLLLFAYGILIALTVVAEPMAALLWFAYTGAVLVRFLAAKRKTPRLKQGAFLLRPQTFRFLLYGILVTAALFLLFLFKNNSWADIAANIGNLFTGTEYDFSTGDFLISGAILKEAVRFYGTWPAYGIGALTLLTFLTRRYRAVLKPFIATALFILTAFALLSVFREPFSASSYSLLIRFFGMPMFLSGPVCMMLLNEREKRLEAFWWLTFSVGLLTDISSEVMIGIAAFSAGAASAMLMLRLISECFASCRINTDRLKKTAFAASALVLALTFLINTGAYVLFDVKRTTTTYIEDCSALDFNNGKADTLIGRGPLKGLYTTPTIHRIYNAYLDDLDTIEAARSGAVYIYGLYGYLYLYLYNAPSSALSAWYVKNEEARQAEYFRLHPDKTPEYIYIPQYYCFTYRTVLTDSYDDLTTERKLHNLRESFECNVTEGNAGLIVHITGTKYTSNGPASQ